MVRAAVIHVVDPDAGDAAGFSRVLAGAGYSVRSFTSGASFLGLGLPARPECVVAETHLGDISGLELQERLCEADPTASIVFASGRADVRLIVRAMRAGAVDFLEKPVPDAGMLDAVARAVERSASLRNAEDERSTALELFGRLTPRERAIFAQVLQGRLNKQIAAMLDCQEATVKVHRSRLMRKLGVRSVARLVQFAQHFGLDEAAPVWNVGTTEPSRSANHVAGY